MGIPNKFDRLGTITDELPAGYLAAEFLEFSGTQYCRTSLTIPDLRAQIKYQIGIRKNCVVASVYRNYSPAGHYGFYQQSNNNGTGAITTLVGVTAYKYDNPIGSIIEAEFDYSKQFCRVNTITKYGTVTPADDKPVLYIGAQNGVASNVTYGTTGAFFTGRIMAFEAWYETGKVADFVPILDEDGIACFYDKVNKQTFTNDGTGQFIVGMTIEQARQLSNLPVTADGVLTVSLPWEAQWDAGVQNALDIASTKGWTITVQYRDPESIAAYLPISFLESTGTQRILLDVTATDDLGGSLDYVDFYANTDAPMLSAVRVNNSTPRFYFPYSSKGTSYIGWDTWNVIGQSSNKNLRTTAILNLFNDRKYKMSFGQDVFEGLLTKPLPAALSDQHLILFCYTNETVYRYVTGRVFSLVLTQSKTVIRRLIPALTPTGIPCMFDTVNKNTFTNDGTGSFIAGFDTVEQSRKLASLPDVTTETDATKKSLTVSLPWEAQWDAGVQAALQVATDRGWTLTVQYREPEIATTNTPISFLESTGSQYIATDFVPNNESGILLKSYLTTLNDTIPCGSRNSAITNTRFYAVRSIRRITTSTGARGYGWGAWFSFQQTKPTYVETTYLNWMNDRFAKCKQGQQSLSLLPFEPEYPLYLFAANIAGEATLFFEGRIWTVALSQGSRVVRTFLPVITPAGRPCMWEKITRTLHSNSSTSSFIAGFDTAEQARKLATLPDVTAETDTTKTSLTVSIPWESQWDVVIQAALQIAANRGWTIIVQYRDPEAATENIPISFLESTGTQYIDTLAPIHEADVVRCVVQNTPAETTQTNYMFGGNSSPGITFSCGPYGTLQADPYSWWAFAWAGTKGGAVMYVDPELRFKKWDTTLFNNKVTIKVDSQVIERTLTGQPGEITGERTIYLFGVNYTTPKYTAGRIYHFAITNAELNYALALTPTITPTGIPCMYDVANKKIFTNEGTGSFIAGFDTIEQAMKLATLPDVTAETDATKKSLTVSLPWEAQWDERVQAALQIAADRGWIITVQYRDPEVATANIPISFLESTGTQYIDTLYVPNNETGMLVNYKATVRKDYMVIGVQDVIDGTTCTIYPVRYDATGYNVACWGAQGYYGSGTVTRAYHRWESTLNWRNDRLTTITSLDDGHRVQGALSTLGMPQGTGVIPQFNRSLWFFGRNNQGELKFKFTGRIYFVKISQGIDIVHNWIPALDSQGIPCMFDRVTKQPFYNSGAGQFIVGFDTAEQARSLAYLPDVTAETDETKKSLTVSLPWEAQLVITGVPAALQVAADRGWTITVQYRDPEADNAYYTKYANCVSLADLQAVNADYKNDLTGDGTWIYPLDNFTGAGASGENGAFRSAANLKSFNARAPKITNMNYMFAFTGTVEYVNLAIMNIANVTNCRGAFRDTKVSKEVIASFNPKSRDFHQLLYYVSTLFETRDDGKTYFPYFPVINEVVNGQATFMYRNTSKLYLDERYTFDAVESTISMFQNGHGNHWGGLTGTVRLNLINCKTARGMFSNCTLLGFYSPLPKLSEANNMFNKCLLDKESVLSILDELPTWTDGAAHAITLGIHIDHQNDADIDAAVIAAEEKGWTVSVQWNGTATAQSTSTFGLRKPPIYAKLDAVEHPDGVIENILDWGHYVTNWAENGYQEFSSIEEAQTHFNINQTEEV